MEQLTNDKEQEEVKVCLKCFLPPSEECELCNGNTITEETKEELYKELEFDDEYDS